MSSMAWRISFPRVHHERTISDDRLVDQHEQRDLDIRMDEKRLRPYCSIAPSPLCRRSRRLRRFRPCHRIAEIQAQPPYRAAERALGVRLLNLSSRRFSVTEVGREYYDRCVAVLVETETGDQVIVQVRAESFV